MHRITLTLLVVGCCTCDALEPKSPDPEPAAAAAPDASKAPPVDPKSAGPKVEKTTLLDGLPGTMPPASGTLAERPFVPKKGILRFSAGQHTLDFWGSSVGGRCEHQLSPPPEPFLAFSPRTSTPWTVGRTMKEDELTVVYGGGEPLADNDERALLVIDAIDEPGQVARGRLDVRALDGTAYAGAFEVTYCTDRVVERETGGEIAGVRWGEPVAPEKIPATPVAAELGGRRAEIVHIAAGRVPGVPGAPLFVDLFTAQPPEPCALHVGMGVGTPGFALGLGPAPEPGDIVRHSGGSENDAAGPVYALATVRVHEDDPIQISGAADMIVVVDRIDARRIVGRVYAAFRDRGKSLVVGRFDAKICGEAEIR